MGISPVLTQYIINIYVPKNTLSECCWSHSATPQSQVAGTPCVWKLNFWLFLTKAKPDQAFPSDVHGKIWPHSTQFWVMIFSISPVFGTPCTVYIISVKDTF